MLALVVAMPTVAAEPAMHGVRQWSAPSLTIYSHNETEARFVVERAAQVEHVMSMLWGAPRIRSNPLYVLLVRSSVWTQYLRPSDLIASEFLPARFRNYVLLSDVNDRWLLRKFVDHEFTHALLRRHYSGSLPHWFDEGTARFVEGNQMLRDSLRIGLPFADSEPGWIPLEKLLRADRNSVEYLDKDTGSFHHQSWAFVHKGMTEPAFGKQINAYIQALNDGHAIDEAVQRSFGMTVAELDRVVALYTRRRAYPTGRLPVEWPPAPTISGATKLTELEGLELLAQVMLDTGINASRLEEVADAARKAAPDSPRAKKIAFQVALRNAAIGAERYRELEPATDDPAMARAVGIALFERSIDVASGGALPADWHAKLSLRAFELLMQSERALPPDPEAAWALGSLSALLKREHAFALRRLQESQTMLPPHADIAMVKALLHDAMGQRDAMIEETRTVARLARSPGQRLWARQRLSAIQD